MPTINDGKFEVPQKDTTPQENFSAAAASAYTRDALDGILSNRPIRTKEDSQSTSLEFKDPFSKQQDDKPNEKAPSDKPNDAPQEATNEAPTPEQIELNKQVAKGMELLKEGKIDELCKLAKEIGNKSDDGTCGAFEKKLRAESKMDISFLGNGKFVLIGTNDSDPNSSDKVVTSKAVKIKDDGTLVSAKEIKSGGGFGGKGEEKELDPKQTYDELMKLFKKNMEEK